MAYVWADVLPSQVADDAAINALGNFVEGLDVRVSTVERPQQAEIRRAAALSVATGATFVVCPFDDDGAGARDPWGFWAASPNPTRIIVPAGLGGRLFWRADVQWDFNVTGSRSACFSKNGGNVNAATASRLGQDGRRASDATETACRPEFEDNFVAGDYMELWLNQTSGVALSVANSTYTAPAVRVYVKRLGPAL